MIHTPLFRLLSVLLLLLASGCNKSSPYDRLCKIYEEYSSAGMPRDVAAVKITEHVERDLPEIYQDYVVVVMNPVDSRYVSFKELARKNSSQGNWSCEAVRQFYIAPAKSP